MLALAGTPLGVTLLGLAAVYLSLTSTIPARLASVLGVDLFDPRDPMELYWWPPFVTLCVALCVNLALATLLRIPLRLRHAGAWCSHAGLMALACGALWYAGRSVSGDSVAVRTRRGFSPIRYVYRKGRFAAYVTPGGAGQAAQTDLGPLVPRGEPRELDVPVAGAGDGVEIRATRFYPSATIVRRWRDASPNRVPAVQFRITDGEEAGTLVLSPSLPDCRQYGGRRYVVIYHAGITPEALAKLTTPGDPNAGPGMPHDIALIVTGRQIEPTLAVVRPDGSRWHAKMEVGKPLDVPLAGRTVRIEPVRFFEHAARVYEVGEPGGPHAGHDHAGAGIAGPVVRLDVRAGEWRRTTHVLFSAYDHLAPPQLLDLPGKRALWLSFSRPREELPATLHVRRAEYQTYPGSQIPKDYRCDIEIVAGGQRRRETLSLNHPVTVGKFQFSQGSWGGDPHDPSQIQLGAASRPGLWVIWTGCVMICLGFPVAFYVKPLLGRDPR